MVKSHYQAQLVPPKDFWTIKRFREKIRNRTWSAWIPEGQKCLQCWPRVSGWKLPATEVDDWFPKKKGTFSQPTYIGVMIPFLSTTVTSHGVSTQKNRTKSILPKSKSGIDWDTWRIFGPPLRRKCGAWFCLCFKLTRASITQHSQNLSIIFFQHTITMNFVHRTILDIQLANKMYFTSSCANNAQHEYLVRLQNMLLFCFWGAF